MRGELRRFIYSTLVIWATLAPAFVASAAEEKTVSPQEVFQLRVRDKKLELTTMLAQTPADEYLPVRFGTFSGTLEVHHAAGPAGAKQGKAPVVPAFFKLEANSDAMPGQLVGLRVTWFKGRLDLQYSEHFTGTNRFTRLTRVLAPSIPGEFDGEPDVVTKVRLPDAIEKSVEFKITESGGSGREPLNWRATEPDFFQMLRKHAQGTNRYLRPIFRTLGQEGALTPEPSVAWQVFSDKWVPSDALKRDVNAILPKLDAAKAADREAASTELKNLGGEATMFMLQLDRSKLSAEQNLRIEAAVSAHAPLPRIEATRLRSDISFLLDCLNSQEKGIRSAALERLRAESRRPVEFDESLEPPARDVAVAKLREKLTK